MGLRLLAAATSAVPDEVWQAIADAKATGTNARQMVLNRDATLNQASIDATAAKTQTATLAQQQASLEQLAATLGAAIPASEVTHTAFDNRIKALETALSALSGKTVTAQSKRVTTTQLLALGASVDLTATWPTPFADANYVTIPLLDASSGIANVQGPFWKSQTAAAAVVTVKANIAVAAGLSVNVVGLRFG